MKRKMIPAAAVAVTLGSFAGSRGEKHNFVPTEYYTTFFAGHPPVLRIKPGDQVATVTIDARGFDARDMKIGPRPNPQTGPFFIEGAAPGDTLVVNILKIEPNRTTAWSSSLLAPYVVDPAFLRSEASRKNMGHTWQVDKEKSIVWLEQPGIHPERIELPIRPMLGCVATAPDRKEAVSTITPDKFGGNMDYPGVVAGVKLMLPVYEPGALLFVGDGHVRQGDGEVLGDAMEISMDVEFSVDLIKQKKIEWPRLENEEYIAVLGSARPLLQALQHATTELQRWLTAEYGCDEQGSSALMGHVLEYDIANVVDPHFTVVAKIRKNFLPKKPEAR